LQVWIDESLNNLGINSEASKVLSTVLAILVVALLCVLGNLIARKVLLRLVSRLIKQNKYTWDDKLYERKVFHRTAHLVTPLIIGFFTGFFPAYELMIKRVLSAYVTLVLLLIIDSLLNAADDIYRTVDISKTRPIKGILQVIKIVAFVVGGIVIISSLIGQNPLILLGGLGALSAVIILVFQSSILGFVAGLQMTSNDMVRIGDWIEMPKYDADGTVIDLTLTTVKVRNFDNTITTIPAHAMISDSFRNWRGMKASGGRRIKRSICMDVTSIGFLTEEMLEGLSKVEYLKEYIAGKRNEIEIYNRERNIDISVPVNGRRMTNIGTFRFYVYNYLRNHPGIHKGMTLMVRQLSPGPTGLPLEVYAFTATTEWIEYENIQSDIFDHLFAVLPHFGLRAFQEPAGYDIVSLRKNGVFE
jgi:miniconductance mechanosensitive channel